MAISLPPSATLAYLNGYHIINYTFCYLDGFAVDAVLEVDGIIITGGPDIESIAKKILIKWLPEAEQSHR